MKPRAPILAMVFLVLLSLLAVGAPAYAAPASGDAAFARAANAAIDRVAREDGFSGTILLARGNTVLLRKAEGFADRKRRVAVTLGTRFPLESITKQFTAVAILQLAGDGKLKLDDRIAEYYAPLPPAWADITIAQLLRHASGIVDCRACGDANFRDYRDYINGSMASPLAFPPGTGMLYSNAGYGLLAAAIERASGQTYGDFVRTRIMAPLHMTQSGYGALPAKSARGYIHNADGPEWREGAGARPGAMAGFGGLYSTVGDMLIWSRALKTNVLLSSDSRTAMFTNYGHDYGFGWRFAEKFGRKLIWHSGNDGNGGYASLLDEFPDEDLTLIVLTNNTGLTKTTATLSIEGKAVTFPANAAREAVEQVESLYFTGKPPGAS
jgi:D-alanyl-D-alanine carboxypeptidase